MSILQNALVYLIIECEHVSDICIELSTQFVNYFIPPKYEMVRLLLQLLISCMLSTSFLIIVGTAISTVCELIYYIAYILMMPAINRIYRRL